MRLHWTPATLDASLLSSLRFCLCLVLVALLATRRAACAVYGCQVGGLVWAAHGAVPLCPRGDVVDLLSITVLADVADVTMCGEYALCLVPLYVAACCVPAVGPAGHGFLQQQRCASALPGSKMRRMDTKKLTVGWHAESPRFERYWNGKRYTQSRYRDRDGNLVDPTAGPKIKCRHCGEASVTSRQVRRKQGVSGGKATGAVLTLGWSTLLTGLSRKATVTELHCASCGLTYDA